MEGLSEDPKVDRWGGRMEGLTEDPKVDRREGLTEDPKVDRWEGLMEGWTVEQGRLLRRSQARAPAIQELRAVRLEGVGAGCRQRRPVRAL